MTITYDLFDLPTAQHKAGLAGLILQIRSMEDRAKKGGPPAPDAVPDPRRGNDHIGDRHVHRENGSGAVRRYVRRPRSLRWRSSRNGQSPEPKRVEEVEETDEEGKKKRVKHFIYEVTQPRGHFLRQHLPDGEGVWLKLSRNMLWAISARQSANPDTL